MCAQQKMNLYYILARATWALGEASLALQMLERALEYSVLLHDRHATAELYYRSGAIKRAWLQVDAALRDLRASRKIIDDLKEVGDAAELRLEMDVALATGMAQYFQARYGDALQSLAEAHRLQALAQTSAWDGYLITWIAATVQRQRGRPDLAFPILTKVAEQVDAMPAPGVYARVYATLAQVALDRAERARARGEDRVAEPLLTLARAQSLKAIEKGEEDFDNGGVMLARLNLVRRSQLIDNDENRRGVISTALRFAENSDEHPTLAEAQIAMAQEFSLAGDAQAAHNLLRQVVARSAVSEIPYIGEPAKALLRRIGGYEGW